MKYDWLAWNDVEKFLKFKNEFGEIYGITTINQTWPYNMVKFWENDDSFYISAEFCEDNLWRTTGKWDEMKTEWFNPEELVELEEKAKSMSEELFEKLPELMWVMCIHENAYGDIVSENLTELWNPDSVKYANFIYKKVNSEIKFFDWRTDLWWFDKQK